MNHKIVKDQTFFYKNRSLQIQLLQNGTIVQRKRVNGGMPKIRLHQTAKKPYDDIVEKLLQHGYQQEQQEEI